MKNGGRIGGTAWVDRCDNCTREITIGHRWRRRHLCDDCAEVAVKQDIARSSMMLGNIARGRKEEAERRRKEQDAARQRRRREKDKAKEHRREAEHPQVTGDRAREVAEAIRAGGDAPYRHPIDATEAGCPECGRYDGMHGPGCKVVAEILKVTSALKSNRQEAVLEVLGAEFPSEIIAQTLRRLAREGPP